jgi:protein SCO1/2
MVPRCLTTSILFAALTLELAAAPCRAEEHPILELDSVDVSNKLGNRVNTQLELTTHDGTKTTLGSFLDGKRPLLLTLNYYRCPHLCTLTLNAVSDTLRNVELDPGSDFRALTVSIDSRETADLALQKRRNQLSLVGRGEIDWTYAVASEEVVRELTASVGFGYRWLPEEEQFAHPAAIFVLSPDGKLSRYLDGLATSPRDLKFALIDASDGNVGGPLDRLILSCFRYDHVEGEYTAFAFGIMRLGGGLTVAVMAIVLSIFWRKERRQRRCAEVVTA